MKNIKFQYYKADIKKPKVLGTVTLRQFISSTKQPKNKQIFDEIARCEAVGDMDLKANIKKNNLYAFTPCVQVRKFRRYADITAFNGIAILDFDHLESPEYSTEFKDFLFNEYPFIICAYLSPSKHGVKALCKVPVCKDVNEFKRRYKALESVFKQYNGYDPAPQNCVLPLFQSYDPDMLVRNTPETFTAIAEPKPEPKPRPIKQDIDVTDRHRKFIISNFLKAINNITDVGHPYLRNAVYSLGGYVAGGYISESEAIQLAETALTVNPHLAKKPQSYRKTIKDSINKGKYKPLYLKY